MNYISDEILMHYGMPRRSGRYPWGSGENPYQHSGDFLSRVKELQDSGLSEKEIAEQLGMSTTELRAKKSQASHERRADLVATAKGLREKGYSLNEIAEKMGYKNDSSVRALLNENTEKRMKQAKITAEYLKGAVNDKGMIDVGVGVERELGISKEKLKESLEILKEEGYEVYTRNFEQLTNPGKYTRTKILCPPGTEYKDVYKDEKINSLKDYEKILTDDGTKIRKAFEYPESMDSSRLMINYAEDGGEDKDGLIEIRRGVDDLSLGNSHYAQVRILVDNNKYLKGMAVYSDNLPDGVDVIFNTNKKKGTPKEDVLKNISDDPSNPFGSLIKERGGQSYYDDPNGRFVDPETGKRQSLSLINKRAEEGDWKDWKDSLPSQFLSKQNTDLIKKQLRLSISDKKLELYSIENLNNPTAKRKLLQSFAEDCDSAAVHLQAAALPRQKYQVILPLTTIKDNEVYAPNYISGEQVALIRFPHGGTFEIPILTVNNKNVEGKRIMSNNPKDAIGINGSVASRLSGADFDGDTVMVIPLSKKFKINSSPALEDLKNFKPKEQYGPGSTSVPYKIMSENTKQNEMGRISNLITDMTLKGATSEELARAVKHSMVVIDAVKHELNYKKSYEDNGIEALKKKYQKRIDEDGNVKYGGASTLISRAKSPINVIKRQGSPKPNPDGSISYKIADDAYYVDRKTGKEKFRTQKSTQMAEVKDARELSSGTIPESLYAQYANSMKAMANYARKEANFSIGKLKYSPSAKKTYQEEVASLNSKLNISLKNAPREREAQRIAGIKVDAIKKSNPDMSKEEIKKLRQREVVAARELVGAKRHPIEITPRELEAIQAGAITDTKLMEIFNHTDSDTLKELFTPRGNKQLSSAQKTKIKAMEASGYSNAEIAKALGISSSTVSKYL